MHRTSIFIIEYELYIMLDHDTRLGQNGEPQTIISLNPNF